MWTYELPAWVIGLRVFGLLAGGTVLACLAILVRAIPLLDAPRFGLRGKRRALARDRPDFVRVEPILRCLASGVACLPLTRLREILCRLASRAGEPSGLCADEWITLFLLSLLGPGWTTSWVVEGAGFSSSWSASVWVLAAILPASKLWQANRERAKQLERSLPTAMDLCVLCMGAGADFPAALKFVVADLGVAHAVCREELSLVLDELALGRTRVQALAALGERTGSAAVRDFIAAVCQSQTKGTPLVQALSLQASTLRERRSVLAEEAAAKAGVKLMFPLLLMVASLMLIVFGPFIVNGLGI